MTGPVRSPFRRFPWVQLVFCVACLGMAGWTWMRYSYCYDATPGQISATWGRSAHSPWLDSYIAVTGVHAVTPKGRSYILDEMNREINVGLRTGSNTPLPSSVSAEGQTTGNVNTWRGRFVLEGTSFAYFDPDGGRLHPASIAGLVVGAMGVFIFGLYLRRWLRERKAA
ncbi:MAG: hypothetical protein ACYS9X_24600 [Planctomycetota bacterium]|jgi:hypothetical protein